MKKQKPEPDWRQFGQFVSMIVTLFTIVRDTLQAMDVGVAEALAWATGPGREAFVEVFVKPLGGCVLNVRPKPITASIQVDLSALPKKPGSNFSVEDHRGSGIVTLEKRTNGLYVDGRKLVLTQLDPKGRMNWKDLKDDATRQAATNANILDALLAHPELFPDDWKWDERGRTRFIFFWGTIYRDGNGQWCVRFAEFREGKWRDGRYPDNLYFDQRWSAVLAS